jgi:hypothetical protein
MNLKFCHMDGKELGLPIDEAATTCCPGRVSLSTTGALKMLRLRKIPFARISKTDATPGGLFLLTVKRRLGTGRSDPVPVLFPVTREVHPKK